MLSRDEIVCPIYSAIEEFMAERLEKLEDDPQYAIDFNMEDEKIKLKNFLEGSLIQNHLKLIDEHVGLIKIDDREGLFQRNKVFCQLKYDDNNLPIYFAVIFGEDFNAQEAEIDLIQLAEYCKMIKNDEVPSYIHNIDAIEVDASLAACQLHSSSDKERLQILSDFNRKWAASQVKMEYIIKGEYEEGICEVRNSEGDDFFRNAPHQLIADNQGNFRSDRLSKLLKREPNPHSNINTPMSFWKSGLTTKTIATVVAAAVGVSAVLYSLTK